MSASPPFDPPYTTIVQTPAGVCIIETLTDGSTREVPAEETLLSSGGPCVALPNAGHGKAAPSSQRKPAHPAASAAAPGNARTVMFLKVPFAEKDEAKRLGAKWDAAQRKWFVPHGVDIHVFARWWQDALKQEMKLKHSS